MKSPTSNSTTHTGSRGLIPALLITAIVSFAAASAALADGHKHKDKGPHIYPPESRPFGKTYPEWHAAFWQWALELPLEGHPFLDTPEFDFSAGQSGSVWFVGAPDGPLTRTATIPPGKALFLTLRDVETSTLEQPPFFGATEAEQRANSVWFADHIVDVFCVINGVPVTNLEDFRFQSPQFEFTAPTPWVFGNFDPGPNIGGTGTGVGDGYFLMVEFPKGQHTIHYGGTYHFEAGELGNEEPFDLPHDVTIQLTVGNDHPKKDKKKSDDDRDDRRDGRH